MQKRSIHGFSSSLALSAQLMKAYNSDWTTLGDNSLRILEELKIMPPSPEAKPILNWPEFDLVCKLTLQKIVPQCRTTQRGWRRIQDAENLLP